MNDKTEKNTSDDNASDTGAQKTPAPVDAKPDVKESVVEPKPAAKIKAAQPVTKNQRGFLVWVSLILAVGALSGSAYIWQQFNVAVQQQQSLQVELSALVQRLSDQASATRELQQNLDRQNLISEQALQQTQQQMTALRQQLASQQKRLLALSTTDRDDWLLAEADYLMRLANQRLLMGKELDGALQLLLAADEIFRELDDSALFTVREALAENISALKTASRFDIEGLYLQLGALAKQAQQLRLFELPQLTITEPEVVPAETWQQQMEVGFAAAAEKLSQYISYHRLDENYRPLLGPEYEAAVRQNLQLMFEQAQLALLAEKQELYQRSLLKAQQWLDTYYTLDQAATKTIQSEIENLMQQNIVIELPDISGAPRVLKDYIEMIHKISTNETTQEPAQ